MVKLPRLLKSPNVRRLLGAWLVGHGLAGFLAPRQMIRLSAWLGLREAFENPGDMEPTDTAVQLYRDASLATMVFGVLTLRRASQDRATATAQRFIDEAERADENESDEDESEEGPVEVDIESDD